MLVYACISWVMQSVPLEWFLRQVLHSKGSAHSLMSPSILASLHESVHEGPFLSIIFYIVRFAYFGWELWFMQ